MDKLAVVDFKSAITVLQNILFNHQASLPAFEMQSKFMKLRYIGAYWEISAVLVGQLSISSVSGFVSVSTELNAHMKTLSEGIYLT